MKNNVFPTEKVKVRTLLFNFNGYYFWKSVFTVRKNLWQLNPEKNGSIHNLSKIVTGHIYLLITV